MSNNEKFLKDYQKPDFLIKNTELFFEILENKIIVKSILSIVKNNSDAENLVLDGEDLTTVSVHVDGKKLIKDTDYSENSTHLTIFKLPTAFTVEIVVDFNPFTNTHLMGIYKTNTCIASQCEPEGFRRITWFIDRPDVMSVWKVSITANHSLYPTTISNGNLSSETIENNISVRVFEDPYPKPSYLFAFVAGKFDSIYDTFTTMSGKNVNLYIYVEEGKKDQSYFAMESLKKSMKWDEETFKLEYDLDIFSIVAVSDFNMGAMENKSLNIFNDALILANPYIATDEDYYRIEAVVAHEYFHNYTGDRITCRDWFQLTLKEGLTVFRDHKFSQDVHNKDIFRIRNVQDLRLAQFPEDASPLAHPIRPASYIEMNNFYTSTVYEKGSEIIAMIETIIGEDNFKKGIDTYFANFDGQAVTCEDFLWSMETASGVSLDKFKIWYEQAGTPSLSVTTEYINKQFIINLEQTTVNKPVVLPIKTALIDKTGHMLNLIINGENHGKEITIILDEKTKKVVFDVPCEPVLSINRDFSAPIILNYTQNDDDLITLIKYDSNGFIRFESAQLYIRSKMIGWINNAEQNKPISVEEVQQSLKHLKEVIQNYSSNLYLTAFLLSVPQLTSFTAYFPKDFPLESIIKVINLVEEQIAINYEHELLSIFNAIEDNEELFNFEMMAKRVLKNKCLIYLAKTMKAEHINLVKTYYASTKNMTKRIACLVALKDVDNDEIYSSFYNEYKNYSTVINKWISLNVASNYGNPLDKVKQIEKLDVFSYSNPNNLRALIGGFTSNYLAFHNLDGSGYNFLANKIIEIDKMNPHMSASIAKVFSKVNIYKEDRKTLQLTAIKSILQEKDLSKGLQEILGKIVN